MLSLTELLPFFGVRPTTADKRRVIAITQMLMRIFPRLRAGPQKSVKKRFKILKLDVKKRFNFPKIPVKKRFKSAKLDVKKRFISSKTPVKKRFISSKTPVKKRLLFKEIHKMIVGPVRGLRWFQAFFFLRTKNASTANMAMAATAPAISMYLTKSVPFLESSKTLLASFSAAP